MTIEHRITYVNSGKFSLKPPPKPNGSRDVPVCTECVLFSPGRHRRSRMRYLGQDLNKLGIVRAVPVFDSPAKQDTGLPGFMKGDYLYGMSKICLTGL